MCDTKKVLGDPQQCNLEKKTVEFLVRMYSILLSFLSLGVSKKRQGHKGPESKSRQVHAFCCKCTRGTFVHYPIYVYLCFAEVNSSSCIISVFVINTLPICALQGSYL